MKKLLIIFICFLQIYYIQADTIKELKKGSCDTNINDRGKQSFLTFFGDSLGDFVDTPTHGIVGWDAYLGFYRQDIDWRVQNFAILGWTTGSIYNVLKDCLENADIRKDFRMSNTIALEIGGNDMVNYTPTLIFMPWKYWTYKDPLTNNDVKGIVDVVIHNIKVLIYFFRHPLIDKNVLVMGNFPALSYSPTLGHVGDYFASFKKMTDVYYKKWEEENRFIHVERDDQIENLTILQDVIVAVLSLVNPGYSIPYTLNELFDVKLPEILEELQQFPITILR